MSASDPYADKNVGEMEEEIARTRDALGEDLDALAWQLSPERFKGHAQASVDRAQTAAMGGIQEASETLSERAREGSSSVVGALRRHQLPVTLVSLGVAVLATAGGARPRQASGTRVGASYVAAAPKGVPAKGAERVEGGQDTRAEGSIHMSDHRPTSQSLNNSGHDVRAASTPKGRRKRKRGRGLGALINKHPIVAGAMTVLAGMTVGLTLSGTTAELESGASKRSASSSHERTNRAATETTLGQMPTKVIRGTWSS